jgi:hypothetical protein
MNGFPKQESEYFVASTSIITWEGFSATEQQILSAINSFCVEAHEETVWCGRMLRRALKNSGRWTNEAELALTNECNRWVPLANEFHEALVCLVNVPQDGAFFVEGYGNFGPLETPSTHPLFLKCRLTKEGKSLVSGLHAITINPSWLTSSVLLLAQGIFSERAFDRLPILACVLEDAGCDNPDILDHCRGPGLHTRGCFVVDRLLAKE